MPKSVVVEPPDAQHRDDATVVELGLAIKRLRARMRAESPSSGGWTISQLAILSRIIERGPITASALAELEHVRPQSIAETVRALRADELVVATPDPADGRKVLLTATDAGRAALDEVRSARGAWLQHAVEAVIEPGERADLARAVELLNRLAECDTGPAPRDGWRA
jgi:DNA-binding MarR family transcriptional regulator